MSNPLKEKWKDEFRPARLLCLDNGHRFTKKVWKKVWYEEGHDEPDDEVLDEESWDVRCPECGSRVRELGASEV